MLLYMLSMYMYIYFLQGLASYCEPGFSVVARVGVNDIHGICTCTAVTSNPETNVYTTTTPIAHT